MEKINVKDLVKKWAPLILALLPLAAFINAIFPGRAKSFFSKSIAKVKGFNGRFDHLSISFFSPAIRISKFSLYENDTITNKENVLISIETIEIKLDRKALLKGEINAQITITSPFIDIIKEGLLATHSAQLNAVQLDIPISIEQLTLTNGTIQYRDNTTGPLVNLKIERIEITASGLSTSNLNHSTLPGSIELKGVAYDGYFKVNVKTDLAVMPPMFETNAEIRLVNMAKLNDVFLAYAGFDVHKGTFSAFIEAASVDGRFKGYVKPVIENLQVAGSQDIDTGFWHIAKEKLIGIAASLIENEKHAEIATKIPFEGTFKYPTVHIIYAIVEVLRNAFISALKPSVDNEISMDDAQKIK